MAERGPSPCDAEALRLGPSAAPPVPTLACGEDKRRNRMRGEREHYCADAKGRASGAAFQRYASGELAAVGRLSDDEPDGEWVFYGRSGRETMRITYDGGVARAATWSWLGRTERCPDDTVPWDDIPVNGSAGVSLSCCEQILVDPVRNVVSPRGCRGPAREWHPSGLEKCEMQYHDEMPHGPMRCWWPNGQLAVQGNWDRGLRTGVWHHCLPDGRERIVVSHNEQGEPDHPDPGEPSY